VKSLNDLKTNKAFRPLKVTLLFTPASGLIHINEVRVSYNISLDTFISQDWWLAIIRLDL
jgi:hypothetical protein